MSVYRYRAYGLEIQADRSLPGLMRSGRGEPDVVVRHGRVDVPEDGRACEQGREVRVEGEDVIVRWKQLGSVLVHGGREIIIDPRAGSDDRISGLIAVGTGMGILLHQRGLLTLHASAVAVDGRAVLFLGGKGSGKSTTAFAFYDHGYRFITDDLAALRVEESGEVFIAPGGPSTKLTERAAAVFQVDEAELSTVYTGLSKRYHALRDNFDPGLLPVEHIYILDYLDDGYGIPTVESMSVQEAVIQLVSHSFALRFLGEQGNEVRNLGQAARVARGASVCRIRRPRNLHELSELVECIERDVVSQESDADIESMTAMV